MPIIWQGPVGTAHGSFFDRHPLRRREYLISSLNYIKHAVDDGTRFVTMAYKGKIWMHGSNFVGYSCPTSVTILYAQSFATKLNFLTSIYQLDGNRKAIPNVSKDTLRRFANISSEATSMLEEIVDDMMATQPTMIGYPDETSQSNYYPGKLKITAEEIDIITDMIEDNGIGSENTRLQKLPHAGSESFDSFHVLQASAEKDDAPKLIGEVIIGDSRIAKIFLCRGDHSEEMEKVCLELLEARKYSLTAEQQTELLQLVECFKTGDYKTAFWSSLKTWVKDKNPRVEHSIGWLSAYRDLNSARTDWQATVGITDGEETKKMSQLVAMSTDIIRTLPWAIPGLNDGKGPFEHANMNIPDFSIIHGKYIGHSNPLGVATSSTLTTA